MYDLLLHIGGGELTMENRREKHGDEEWSRLGP